MAVPAVAAAGVIAVDKTKAEDVIGHPIAFKSACTYLKIENKTPYDIIDTRCFDVDNYDFYGEPSNPKNCLQNLYIKKMGTRVIRLELSLWTTACPFALTLHFKDKTHDTFKIDQKSAVNHWTEPKFRSKPKKFSHELTCCRQGRETLAIFVRQTETQYHYSLWMDAGAKFRRKELYESAINAYNEALKLAQTDCAKNAASFARLEVEKLQRYEKTEKMLMDVVNKKKEGKLEEALAKANEALEWADENQRKRIKDEKADIYNNKYGKEYQKEGNRNMKSNNFSAAINNFEKALDLEIEFELRKSIEHNLNNAKIKYADQRANNLQNEGLQLIKQNKLNEGLAKLGEALNLVREDNTRKTIQTNIEEAEKKIENQKAENLQKQAIKLMETNDNEAAIANLQKALIKTSDRNRVISILADIKKNKLALHDKQAKKVEKEGLALINTNNNEAAIEKFDEALRLASDIKTVESIYKNKQIAVDNIKNTKAEVLVKTAQELGEKQKWDEAIVQFLAALRLAKNDKTVKKIKSEVARAYQQLGLQKLEEVLFADAREDQTKEDYEKTRINLQEAAKSIMASLEFKSTKELRQNFDLVLLKIEGNEHFNRGIVQEREGFDLFEKLENTKYNNDNYRKVVRLIDDSIDEYTLAKRKFEKCFKKIKNEKLLDSIKLCSNQLTELGNARGNIVKIMLDNNLKSVAEKDKLETNADNKIGSILFETRKVVDAP